MLTAAGLASVWCRGRGGHREIAATRFFPCGHAYVNASNFVGSPE